MTVELNALKPCSMCGNKPVVSVDSTTLSVSISCEHCHTSKQVSLFEQVSQEWNDEQSYLECHDKDGNLTPPCHAPFCGSEASLHKWGCTDEFSVFCKECPANVYDLESPQDAIAAWNRRGADV